MNEDVSVNAKASVGRGVDEECVQEAFAAAASARPADAELANAGAQGDVSEAQEFINEELRDVGPAQPAGDAQATAAVSSQARDVAAMFSGEHQSVVVGRLSRVSVSPMTQRGPSLGIAQGLSRGAAVLGIDGALAAAASAAVNEMARVGENHPLGQQSPVKVGPTAVVVAVEVSGEQSCDTHERFRTVARAISEAGHEMRANLSLEEAANREAAAWEDCEKSASITAARFRGRSLENFARSMMLTTSCAKMVSRARSLQTTLAGEHEILVRENEGSRAAGHGVSGVVRKHVVAEVTDSGEVMKSQSADVVNDAEWSDANSENEVVVAAAAAVSPGVVATGAQGSDICSVASPAANVESEVAAASPGVVIADADVGASPRANKPSEVPLTARSMGSTRASVRLSESQARRGSKRFSVRVSAARSLERTVADAVAQLLPQLADAALGGQSSALSRTLNVNGRAGSVNAESANAGAVAGLVKTPDPRSAGAAAAVSISSEVPVVYMDMPSGPASPVVKQPWWRCLLPQRKMRVKPSTAPKQIASRAQKQANPQGVQQVQPESNDSSKREWF